MSAFVFIVWRLGLARAGVSTIEGWRRLFWRVWWKLAAKPSSRLTHTIEVPRAPNLMHWSPDPTGLPFCGASRAPWTREFFYSTCLDCRKKGMTYLMQYECNTR